MLLSVATVVAGGAFRAWLGRWAPLAEWVVAIATGALALATFNLARRAREEAKNVADDVRAQKDQMKLGLRAYVFPRQLSSQGPAATLALIVNGGPGMAVNVRGTVYWPNSGAGVAHTSIEIYGESLAPSAEREIQLNRALNDFPDGFGFLRYSDLNGDEWLTDFKVRASPDRPVFEHQPPELFDENHWRRYPASGDRLEPITASREAEASAELAVSDHAPSRARSRRLPWRLRVADRASSLGVSAWRRRRGRVR